ncbi:MAG: LLM class flavin-dependent oxidoreductase, partial [Myxococcota bacterium]
PREAELQARIVGEWRRRTADGGFRIKPAMQPLYVDITDNPESPPTPIHLGFRLGTRYLREHLRALELAGLNHVALNLRFNQTNIDETLERLAAEVLPDFSH